MERNQHHSLYIHDLCIVSTVYPSVYFTYSYTYMYIVHIRLLDIFQILKVNMSPPLDLCKVHNICSKTKLEKKLNL